MSHFIWAGKILRIDLSTGAICQQPTSDFIPFALGGRGIGQWILFREMEPDVEAYDPDCVCSLSAGALTGTLAPASSRLSIDTKNTLTGGVCSSNVGGHFASEMKFAGYDAIVVKGKAPRPVYLWLADEQVELRDASHLWGLDTWQTECSLRSELKDPKVRVALIGPAGERKVRGACLIVDRARAAGRGGAGAVLGAKRLKAIAVRGTGDLRAVEPMIFYQEAIRCREKLMLSQVIDLYREGGSMLAAGAGGPDGTFPQAVRNYQDSYWDVDKSRKIYEPALRSGYEVRHLGCFNCPISCSHYYSVKQGPYKGSKGEGFEVNTARAFGSNLDIDNPAFIIEAHNICSRMGLDVDMAGASLAFAFEAYERGHIGKEEANGLELDWGNHEAAISLLNAIAQREGLGDLLAEGVWRASQKLGRGSEEYALHVKGADLNEASMRPYKAWALGIVLSTHGGGHLDGSPGLRAWSDAREKALELFGNPQPGAAGEYANQSRAIIWHENYKAMVDMLGVCYFTSMWLDAVALSPDDFAALIRTGSGKSYSASDLMKLGQKLHNVEKAFNTLHTGHQRVHDQPPKRLLEPVKRGPFKGHQLDATKWNEMLDEYYRRQGWDLSTGWQTESSLYELGLTEVIDKLRLHNRLSE